MLAIQVAAGIVLAYVIIVNQKKLLQWGGQLFGMLATLATVVAFGWAAMAGFGAARNYLPGVNWSKILMLVMIVPLFLLAMTGGLGLLMLGGLIVRRKPRQIALWVNKVFQGGEKPSEQKANGDKGCLAVFFGLGCSPWP